MKKRNPETDETAPDLKHDTMEFAASTEGEDQLDADREGYEPDEISAEELEAINDIDVNEAAALIEEQKDFEADESNLPTEDWTDDLADPDEANRENRRR